MRDSLGIDFVLMAHYFNLIMADEKMTVLEKFEQGNTVKLNLTPHCEALQPVGEPAQSARMVLL